MTLADLIARLQAADPTQVVRHGFTHPHSYRGDYMDLAFEPASDVPVAAMLAAARSALGATFQGYKGGEFTMGEHTWCWLSEEGDASGETIGALLLDLMLAPAVPAGQAPATDRVDHGTEFVRQADQPDEAGLAAFEAGLASETGPKADSKPAIAAALREHGMVHLGDQVPADEYDCCADAVLAVLPASVDRAAVLLGAAEPAEHPRLNVTPLPAEALAADEVFVDPAAFRAAVLREAADGFDRRAAQLLDGVGDKAVFVAKALRDQAAVWFEAAETLRRLAAASAVAVRRATDETPGEGHAPGTAILCPDCRAKGHAVCMDGEGASEVVHGCPPDGSGLTPCCGRTPFELPRTDRISSEAPVTCPGPAVGAQQPVCKCPAEICQCGHHQAQQPKEA